MELAFAAVFVIGTITGIAAGIHVGGESMVGRILAGCVVWSIFVAPAVIFLFALVQVLAV